MSAVAESFLERILPIVRTRLPRGIDADYLDAFVDRNRPMLVMVIDQNLGPLLARVQAAKNTSDQGDIAELRTPGKRTAANLAAMRLLATEAPEYVEQLFRLRLRLRLRPRCAILFQLQVNFRPTFGLLYCSPNRHSSQRPNK